MNWPVRVWMMRSVLPAMVTGAAITAAGPTPDHIAVEPASTLTSAGQVTRLVGGGVGSEVGVRRWHEMREVRHVRLSRDAYITGPSWSSHFGCLQSRFGHNTGVHKHQSASNEHRHEV